MADRAGPGAEAAAPGLLPRDVRGTATYRAVAERAERWDGPGRGRVVDLTDLSACADGTRLALTVHVGRASGPVPCVAVLDVPSAELRLLAHDAPRRRPAWSPDGAVLACLEQVRPGVEHVALVDAATGEPLPHRQPSVAGSVESVQWSPDGTRLLLLVAGDGAEISDVYGSGRVPSSAELPDWLPAVAADSRSGQRRLLLWRPGGPLVPVELERNAWEAVWAGPDAVCAVTSPDPHEDAWYDAQLTVVRLPGGDGEPPPGPVLLDLGPGQVAVPRAAPSGARLSAICGRASDRDLLAGALHVLDARSGAGQVVDAGGVDVTGQAWRDDDRLVFAGLRGLDSVVGELDLRTGAVRELLSTAEAIGPAELLPAVTPVGGGEDVAVVLESSARPPTGCLVSPAGVRVLLATDHVGTAAVSAVGQPPRRLEWGSSDGTQVAGLLHLPAIRPARGLVVLVHGGPVWCWRDTWPARTAYLPLLLDRGFAVLLPNPRGSQGRGAGYVEAIVGEIGGRDADDVLTGVDAVVPSVLGDVPAAVMGTSYGGVLAAWLATRPGRFAAAVAVSPATDWVSQHYTTNIPASDVRFLIGDPLDPASQYVTRSPLRAVTAATSPTLLTAGLLDLATPAGQAVAFSRALAEHGVPTDLAVYPLEGHDVHQPEAVLDHATRVLLWLEHFLPLRE